DFPLAVIEPPAEPSTLIECALIRIPLVPGSSTKAHRRTTSLAGRLMTVALPETFTSPPPQLVIAYGLAWTGLAQVGQPPPPPPGVRIPIEPPAKPMGPCAGFPKSLNTVRTPVVRSTVQIPKLLGEATHGEMKIVPFAATTTPLARRKPSLPCDGSPYLVT